MGIRRVCGLALCIAALSQRSLGADTGIGFGWDSSALQEVAYRVDLETGAASSLGAVPDLQFVLVGSHSVDYPTGVTAFLGSKGADQTQTLFVLVPDSHLMFAFNLLGFTADMVVQRALVRSIDGGIYLIVTDRSARGVLELDKVTFDVAAGTAAAAPVATLPVSAFGSDAVRIGDDNNIYILTAGESRDSLVMVDTDTGNATEVSLAGANHQALFLCNQVGATPRLFTLVTVRSPAPSTSLMELAPDGTETLVAGDVSWAFLAGSLGCTNNILRGLAPADDGSDGSGPAGPRAGGSAFAATALTLTTFDVTDPEAGLRKIPLSQPNLKVVGATSATVSAVEAPSAASAPATFKLLSRSALRKCLRQVKTNRRAKNTEFGALARTLAGVKRRAGRCRLR